MKEKSIPHPEFGEVLMVKKRGIRRISIKVNAAGTIRVTLPWLVPFAAGELFLRQSEEKISRILPKLKKRGESRTPILLPSDPTALRAMKKGAREILTLRTRELAQQFGFTREDGSPLYGRIALKDNKSNWGSCSAKGNINLNIRLHLLPPHLMDYIILHELCHLRHLNHGAEFYTLLGSICNAHYKQRSPNIVGDLKSELKNYTIS